DDLGGGGGGRHVVEHPPGGAVQDAGEGEEPAVDGVAGEAPLEAGEVGADLGDAGELAGDVPGPDHLLHLAAAVAGDAVEEGGSHQVHQVADQAGGDDLPAQAVLAEALGADGLHGRGREVPDQVAEGGGVVGEGGAEQARPGGELRVGEED